MCSRRSLLQSREQPETFMRRPVISMVEWVLPRCTVRSPSPYSTVHLFPLHNQTLSAKQQNHYRRAGGQLIGLYVSSRKPWRVSETQGAIAIFGWRATFATSRCHQRALMAFFREIACQVKTHHALDTAAAGPRPLFR